MHGRIENIRAIKVFDSRGEETIKVIVYGERYTGSYIFSDDNDEFDLNRIVVLPDIAINRIEEIIKPRLIGKNYFDQVEIDSILYSLDKTKNFSYLGINSILSTSLAISRLAANELELSLFKYLSSLNSIILPVPIVTLFSDRENSYIKEYLLIPGRFDSVTSATYEVKRVISSICKEVECDSLEKENDGRRVAPFVSYRKNIEFIENIITRLGCKDKFIFGISFSNNVVENNNAGRYLLDNKYFSSRELIDVYKDMVDMRVRYFENILNNEDVKELKTYAKNKVLICSNDYSGNVYELRLNNYCSLSEFIKACNLIKSKNILAMISSYGNNSEDSFIVDLCVGLNIPLIRCGNINNINKISKLNRLFAIKDLIGKEDYYYTYIDSFDDMFN